MGFVDGIIKNEKPVFANNVSGMRLTDEIRNKVLNEKAQKGKEDKLKNELLQDLDLYGV